MRPRAQNGARRQDLPHPGREILHAAAFVHATWGRRMTISNGRRCLKSVSGFEMYRKKHGRISPRDIVEFLVLDREFPRSIHYCIDPADESLHAITGVPMGSYRYPSEQLMGLLRSELDFTSVDSIIRRGLHEYLDGLQIKMNSIDNSVCERFFRLAPDVQLPARAKPHAVASSDRNRRGVMMGIRVALHHKTVYQYDRLVTLSPQIVRLRPAPHSRTPVISYSLHDRAARAFPQLAAGPAGQFPGAPGLSRTRRAISPWKWTWSRK